MELVPLSPLVNVVFLLLALERCFQYGRGSQRARPHSARWVGDPADLRVDLPVMAG